MNNRSITLFIFGAACAMCSALPAVASLSPVQIQRIAKQTTVRIKGCSNGSGAIVNKSGNTYTILTAAHATSESGCQVVTADDREYEVAQVTPFINDVDLALVKFTSSKNYPVAKTIDNSDRIESGESVYISGFPVTKTISEPIFTFVAGKVIGNGNKLQANGYSLVYDNPTLPGHSGGPVWNDKGEVIAIHGRGDVDPKIKDTDSPTVRVKTGFNLGITANTFFKIAAQMGIGGTTQTIAAKPPTRESAPPTPTPAPKPRPVDDLIASAVARENKGDYRGILADMNKAISLRERSANAIDPKKDRLYYIRANAKAELGDAQGAIADYDRDIAMNPKRAETYYNRGNTRYKLQNWQQALADYNSALAIAPDRVAALYNRANVKYQLQDKQGAIDDYTRAIAVDPKLLAAYSSRGWVRYEQGDFQGAIADQNLAIAMNHPRLGKIYNQRAFAQYEIGKTVEAIASWRRALSLSDPKQEIQFGLAIALYRQGKQAEALELAEAAIRTDKKLADIEQLKARKWGANIIKDANALLQNPQLRSVK